MNHCFLSRGPRQLDRIKIVALGREAEILRRIFLRLRVLEGSRSHPGGSFAIAQPGPGSVDRFAVDLQPAPTASSTCCTSSGMVPSERGPIFIRRLPFLLTTSTSWCTMNTGVLKVSCSMYPHDLLLTEVSVCQTRSASGPAARAQYRAHPNPSAYLPTCK